MLAVNAVYGFLADCAAMYDKRIYDMFDEAFRWLPLATLVDDVTMVRNNLHETVETTINHRNHCNYQNHHTNHRSRCSRRNH